MSTTEPLDAAHSCTTRDYRPGDAAALAALFRDSVLQHAAPHYNAAQAAAWASAADDLAAFEAALNEGWIRVACTLEEHDEEDLLGDIVGFAQINMPGHITMLYTAPEFARQGVASLLMDDILELGEAMGARTLEAEVSLVAHALFCRLGFVDAAESPFERHGQTLRWLRMQKRLQPGRKR